MLLFVSSGVGVGLVVVVQGVVYSCGFSLVLLLIEEVLVGVVNDAVSELVDVFVLDFEADFLALAG